MDTLAELAAAGKVEMEAVAAFLGGEAFGLLEEVMNKSRPLTLTNAAFESVKPKRLVSKIGSGKTPPGGSEVYVDDGVLFIRSQNVHFDGLRCGDSEPHTTRFE